MKEETSLVQPLMLFVKDCNFGINNAAPVYLVLS